MVERVFDSSWSASVYIHRSITSWVWRYVGCEMDKGTKNVRGGGCCDVLATGGGGGGDERGEHDGEGGDGDTEGRSS